jgi:hypothetical protein
MSSSTSVNQGVVEDIKFLENTSTKNVEGNTSIVKYDENMINAMKAVVSNNNINSIEKGLLKAAKSAISKAEEIISKVVGYRRKECWKISDFLPNDNLYLIHYEAGINLNKFGHLRGVVVDIKLKLIVCKSQGFIQSSVQDELKINTETGDLEVFQRNGEFYNFQKDKFQIHRSLEGVVYRVIKHNGTVYHITYKRLNCKNSRWVISKTFHEMYDELNLPADNVLFDEETIYSPWCYTFLLVHPDLIVASRQDVGNGYVSYLGAEEMWDVKDMTDKGVKTGPIKANEANFETSSNLPSTVENNFVYKSAQINIEEANSFLSEGFYPGYGNKGRLSTGESVLIYAYDDEGKIKKTLQVMSRSYEWRIDMRKNQAYLYCVFVAHRYKTYNSLDDKKNREDYIENYNLIPYMSFEDVDKNLPLVSIEGKVDIKDYNTKNKREYMMWLTFLLSCPLHKQREVYGYLEKFKKEKTALIEFLFSIYQGDIVLEESNRHIQRIVNTASNANRNFFSNKFDPVKSIRNLIGKEKKAIYAMFKVRRDYMRKLTNDSSPLPSPMNLNKSRVFSPTSLTSKKPVNVAKPLPSKSKGKLSFKAMLERSKNVSIKTKDVSVPDSVKTISTPDSVSITFKGKNITTEIMKIFHASANK